MTQTATTHLKQDILGRILAVARHLSASADLKDILSVIIDAMRDTLDAERATVFEFDPKTNELFTTVAHGVAGEGAAAVREIRIPITAGLAGECATKRQIINVPDAYADRRFNQSVDKQTGFRTRSILTIPLVGHDGELVGVAQVLNKHGGPFSTDDEDIAEALAAQAAVAMRRGRLIEDRLVKEKLERDLELARRIQQSSFPESLPSIDGYDIAAWNRPADETGGDVYDVIRDETDGRVVLLMADATGHGIGPALSVTQLRSMLRMAVRLGAAVQRIADHANQQLCHDLPSGRFITAWVGVLDAAGHALISYSAGQAPLLRYRSRDDSFEEMDADTVPFGVTTMIDPAEPVTIDLEPGDLFAVISDGFFEARRNDAAELFGSARVQACLRANRARCAEDILAALRAEVNDFTQGRPPDDDQTAILIKRTTSSH
jgi:phosphoserine phosphatase